MKVDTPVLSVSCLPESVLLLAPFIPLSKSLKHNDELVFRGNQTVNLSVNDINSTLIPKCNESSTEQVGRGCGKGNRNTCVYLLLPMCPVGVSR